MHPSHSYTEDYLLKGIWYFPYLIRMFPRRCTWPGFWYVILLLNVRNGWKYLFSSLKIRSPEQNRVVDFYLDISIYICNQSKFTFFLYIFYFFYVIRFQMMNCNCIIWGSFWLIVLLFLGWPISIALCALHGFLSPLATLIGLDELSEVLLKGACLGRQCAQNVCNGKPLC